MGRYVPPDQEGVLSFNQASGKNHALGQRASKLASQGILTVRFEMPYAVWCQGCPKPTIIAQGVRFNAEKKKVGNYHSTPIWSFTIKHTACGQKLEIRTDPQNTAYVVVSGGKARDHGPVVREGEEGLEILTAEERERRREDAFAVLEGRQEEKVVEKDTKRRIGELLDESDKQWKDPYELNRTLRRGFRAERKLRVKDAQKADAIKDRFALGIELVSETAEDGQRAAAVDFGHFDEDGAVKAVSKPLFSESRLADVSSQSKNLVRPAKVIKTQRDQKTRLQTALKDNTRAGLDPFGSVAGSRDVAIGVRKVAKGRKMPNHAVPAAVTTMPQPCPNAGLVDYESE